ncbi:hypothetical protein LXL04_006654 [Taraxacum kok-saghyz]
MRRRPGIGGLQTVAAARVRTNFASPVGIHYPVAFSGNSYSHSLPYMLLRSHGYATCPIDSIEMSACLQSLQPFHTATASALMTSMLTLFQNGYGWLAEDKMKMERRKDGIFGLGQMLRFQDRLHAHAYFRKAAAGAIRCYIKLYDSPPTSSTAEDDELAKMPASQKKKPRQKQRKAEARAKKAEVKNEEANAGGASKYGKRNVKAVDPDPHGEKLLQSNHFSFSQMAKDEFAPLYLPNPFLPWEVESQTKTLKEILLVERLMLIPQLEALVGRHSRPLTFRIGSQQKKQCFQQAEEHCSKAISLDKKCLEDGVEKMKIQCLEGEYVGNYH